MCLYKIELFAERNGIMAITMKDVAREAGVGLGTVSNYLSGKANVSEEKRQAIDVAIKELNYKFNSTAQALKTKKFMYIGVLISAFTNHFIMNLLSLLERELQTQGYHMIVLEHSIDEATFTQHITHLINRVDGLIAFTNHLDVYTIIKESALPTVIYSHTLLDYKFDHVIPNLKFDHVMPDLLSISRTATAALLKKGHRKIAMLAGFKNIDISPDIIGYKEAYEQANLPFDQSLVFAANAPMTNPQKIKVLLATHPDITAFVALSYRQTITIWTELSKLNLLDKICIIGHDCSDISGLMHPPMCYTYASYSETTQELVNLLLSRIRSTTESANLVIIKERIANEKNIPPIQ